MMYIYLKIHCSENIKKIRSLREAFSVVQLVMQAFFLAKFCIAHHMSVLLLVSNIPSWKQYVSLLSTFCTSCVRTPVQSLPPSTMTYVTRDFLVISIWRRSSTWNLISKNLLWNFQQKTRFLLYHRLGLFFLFLFDELLCSVHAQICNVPVRATFSRQFLDFLFWYWGYHVIIVLQPFAYSDSEKNEDNYCRKFREISDPKIWWKKLRKKLENNRKILE